MQHMNWDDFRLLLALARAESLGGAARLLRLDATTVSRRIKAVEDRAGAALVVRERLGSSRLTQLGQTLADHAEKMELHVSAADTLIGRDTGLSGTVRVTAVPFVLNRLLAPRLPEFAKQHPNLNISLIPDRLNLSLTRREVDVAIRFGEPREGGDAVLAHKIGQVGFSVFTASEATQVPLNERPWLVYDPVVAHLPQAKWTKDLAQRSNGQHANLLMYDLETVFEIVAATATRAVLPQRIARQDPRLIELELPPNTPDMNRDAWLLRNTALRGVERVDAFVKWVIAADLFGIAVNEA
ncbi:MULTISPECIES: LysR family transcriptional regulator [Pacificibacter]|uniref:LysR family transcriptional regulator n=1 Tax=Pacificibacter TaxID=1042323 RepID=UPI001C08ED42|nr:MULTISPECIES: LysR family transcriptional regulator [Pacificibacter]MBU2935521.1 LysR family transcriptional regulator [Pacificibacter marinus]MDO6614018.1 LysR family transcriptional regulator [Pacificibacter sp. 1_MG-2023]